ncbi:MAG: hypothetical protein ACE5MG_11545 [Candidatus Methylomirabilales bacterium]
MKLWHTIFIVGFIALYASLSLVFLGSWLRDAASAMRDAHRQSRQRLGRAGAVIGATVLVSAVVGILIAQGSLTFWP